ncbi:MAG: hypothetical protein EX285_03655 [Thaumarchaeota archaeon]|nr:hypothetical protein [Nitrososphaerota archaeon]
MISSQEPIFFNIETKGFYPIVNKILTINIRSRGKNTIWWEYEKGEKEIIEQFYEFTNKINRKYTKIVGFNILEFDVLFLLERLNHQNYNEPEINRRWERFGSSLAYIDLRQVLGDSFDKFVEQKDNYIDDKSDLIGNIIPNLYGKGEYTKIEECINDELQHIEKMYDMVKKEPFYQELQKLQDYYLSDN